MTAFGLFAAAVELVVAYVEPVGELEFGRRPKHCRIQFEDYLGSEEVADTDSPLGDSTHFQSQKLGWSIAGPTRQRSGPSKG
ncbi:MAG: hypothetical protein AAF497_25415 [Planctomycetota bacterium]